MCFLGFIPAADGASSWPRVGVRHRAAGNAGMTDPQGPPAPQHVLVCFLNVAMWGKKEKKLHVLEELSAARGLIGESSEGPITALNAHLVAEIRFFSANFSWGCVCERLHIHLVCHTESWLGWGSGAMLLAVEAVVHVSGSLLNLVYLCNYILKALKELGFC